MNRQRTKKISIKKLLAGQSLFEVVIALGVVTVILVALVTLAAMSIRNTTFSKNRTSSTRYSQEAVEWLRSERDSDWQIFKQRAATPKWCLPSLDWTTAGIGSCGSDSGSYISETIFRREVEFISIDSQTLEITVKVYWTDSQGTHETRTVTDFTNWKNQ